MRAVVVEDHSSNHSGSKTLSEYSNLRHPEEKIDALQSFRIASTEVSLMLNKSYSDVQVKLRVVFVFIMFLRFFS